MVTAVVCINLFFPPVIALWHYYEKDKKILDLSIKLLLQYATLTVFNIPLTKVGIFLIRKLLHKEISIDSGYYTLLAIVAAAILPELLDWIRKTYANRKALLRFLNKSYIQMPQDTEKDFSVIPEHKPPLVSVLAAFFIVLLTEVAWAWLWLYTETIPFTAGRNVELYYYGSSFILAFMMFPIVYHIFHRLGLDSKLTYHPRREKIAYFVTAAILFGLFVLVFWYSPKHFDFGGWPGHTGKYSGYFTIFLLCAVAVYCVRNGVNRVLEDKGDICLTGFFFCLTVLAFFSSYRWNTFTGGYNIHHFDAWFHSVYRIMHFQPYSDVNVGVYGHYGILFAPFIKLLGGDLRATMLVVSVASAAVLLCYLYALQKLVKNTQLKILASVGLSYQFLCKSNFYVQNNPMRIMFSAFILAFMLWRDERERTNGWLWRLCGGCIVVLALVCNIESGVGVMLAYVGADIVRILQRVSLRSPRCWLKIADRLILCPLFFLLSMLVVDAYNLLAGGSPLSLRTYMFPLLGTEVGGTGYMDAIYYPIGRFPSWWMAVCVLIYGLIAYVLLKTNICGMYMRRDEHDGHIASVAILIAILGAYYINRSAFWNLSIVLPLAVIAIAYIAENMSKMLDQRVPGGGIIAGGCVICCVLLCLFAEMTVTSFFNAEQSREPTRDSDALQAMADQVRDIVEPNTLAIGSGLPALYAQLGWDTGYYGPDGADFFTPNEEGMYGIYKQIRDSETILISSKILDTVSSRAPELFDNWEETHTRIATLKCGAESYFYYCRGEIFEGDGTAENPFQIKTADDLALLAQIVNGGTTYSGMYFLQMDDLDLSGFENWTPIGTYDSGCAFAGIYDGGGHTISNLNIDGTKLSHANVGLFGVLAGTVCNLGIESGHISGAYIGSIASHSATEADAMVINCYNKASLSATGRCGGIVDNFGTGKVLCCINYGELKCDQENRNGGISSYSAGTVWGCYAATPAVVDEYFTGVIERTEISEDVQPQDLNDNLSEASRLFGLENITLRSW